MSPAPMPLRFGTDAQFAAFRAFLERSNYTESAVAGRLGISSFEKFGSVKMGVKPTASLDTPLDVLIRFFLECEPIPAAEFIDVLGAEIVELIDSFGLLKADSSYPPRYRPIVGMCPTRGLFLVGDIGGPLQQLPEDVVYPPILENTQDFLNLIPSGPCENFLDLGAGTGVAAFVAAKNYARHAWASDITERAARFAEFNRRLNSIENATAVRGDMYEPVAGIRFDRIVTHPPYVPVSKATCIFRDGGDDGEQILRRAIEGLPEHLAPGGRFYAQSLISDREGDSAEDRIRRWLGPEHRNFDLALFNKTARDPFDFVARAIGKGTFRPEELQYWTNMFRELKAQYVLYGAIVIQRHAAPRDPFTLRLQKGPHSGTPEMEWALAWNAASLKPDAAAMMLSSAPARSPRLHLGVMHGIQDGVLVPMQYLLRVNHPFEVECKCPAWVASMMELCDGKRTGSKIMEELKANGLIHQDTETGEFAAVLRTLISNGFLELESYRIPEASTGS